MNRRPQPISCRESVLHIVLCASMLSLLAASCPVRTVKLEPEADTTLYRSYAQTARIPKTCVIEVIGLIDVSQRKPAATISFDPQATLREALLRGLRRTCQQTTVSPRGGDPTALDYEREIGILAEVQEGSLNVGGFYCEAELTVGLTLHWSLGEPAVTRTVATQEHRLGLVADMSSCVAPPLIEIVDGVNQLIFESRDRLRQTPASSP